MESIIGSGAEKFFLPLFDPFQKCNLVIFEKNDKIFLLTFFEQILQKLIMSFVVLISHFLNIGIDMISKHQIQQFPVVLAVTMNFQRQIISRNCIDLIIQHM